MAQNFCGPTIPIFSSTVGIEPGTLHHLIKVVLTSNFDCRAGVAPLRVYLRYLLYLRDTTPHGGSVTRQHLSYELSTVKSATKSATKSTIQSTMNYPL